MSGWYSGEVLSNGISIHYTRTGSGEKPPVVLAHGFAENGRCWSRVAQALESLFDVVMYDARGHGRSSAPEDGYTSEARVEDLAGLIRALGLRRPALIGHSMGAATVAMLAAWYPEMARCLVLEDPPWGPPAPPRSAEEEQIFIATMRTRLERSKARSREELIARCRAQHPTWLEEELGPWADARRELSPNIVNILTAPSIPWQDVVRKIGCPILLLMGDATAGGVITSQIADEMTRIWSCGRVAHISGAGHNIRRERFDGFMQAVLDFLGSGADPGVL